MMNCHNGLPAHCNSVIKCCIKKGFAYSNTPTSKKRPIYRAKNRSKNLLGDKLRAIWTSWTQWEHAAENVQCPEHNLEPRIHMMENLSSEEHSAATKNEG